MRNNFSLSLTTFFFLFLFSSAIYAYSAQDSLDHATADSAVTEHSQSQEHESPAEVHHAPHLDGRDLQLWWIIPFVGILLSIAVMPLIAPHFWHHHYGKVSLFWGVLFFIMFTVIKGLNMSGFYLAEVYLGEFIPFIVLLLALFTVGGGIRLKGELVGSPLLNTGLILIGTILASDPDNDQTLEFEIISGNEGNILALNQSTGKLSFVSASPDFSLVSSVTVDFIFKGLKKFLVRYSLQVIPETFSIIIPKR